MSHDRNVAKTSTVATAGCNGPRLEGAEKVRDIVADEEPGDWQLAGSQAWGRQELQPLETLPAVWIWVSRVGQGSNTDQFPPSFPLPPSQASPGMCQRDLQPLLSPELCLRPKLAQGHCKQPGIPPVGYFWLKHQALVVQSVK